jgi:hypothetical protein
MNNVHANSRAVEMADEFRQSRLVALRPFRVMIGRD